MKGREFVMIDGTFPTGTAKIEKPSIAHEIPVWDPDTCIAGGLCVLVCPHAAICTKSYPIDSLNGKAESFQSLIWKGKDLSDHLLTIQVAPGEGEEQ